MADCSTRIIYGQETDQVSATASALGLTDVEAGLLPGLPLGRGLWKVDRKSFVVDHVLSESERAFTDTDPGVGDVETLRYFSDLLGQTRVSLGSSQTGPDGRRSRSESEQREALAPLHPLQQLPDGEAVILYQNLPPARVKLRRWFADPSLRQLSEGARSGLSSQRFRSPSSGVAS